MTDQKRKTGIWLDFKEAFIIPLHDEVEGKPQIRHIVSNIDTGVAKGGSRSNVPYGPQGGVSEREVEERRKHQEKRYFEEIIQEIRDRTDELFVFGPAGAKVELKKAIDSIKHFPVEVLEVRTADSMTQNQIVAEVRKFFVEAAGEK